MKFKEQVSNLLHQKGFAVPDARFRIRADGKNVTIYIIGSPWTNEQGTRWWVEAVGPCVLIKGKIQGGRLIGTERKVGGACEKLPLPDEDYDEKVEVNSDGRSAKVGKLLGELLRE